MAWSDYSHSDCIAVLNAFKVQNPRLLITFTFQFQEVISCDNFCIGLCCKLGSDCFTIFFSFCSGVEHVEEAKRIPQSA